MQIKTQSTASLVKFDLLTQGQVFVWDGRVWMTTDSNPVCIGTQYPADEFCVGEHECFGDDDLVRVVPNPVLDIGPQP